MRKGIVFVLILQVFFVIVLIGSFKTAIYGQRRNCIETQFNNTFSRNNRNSGRGMSNDVVSDSGDKAYIPIQNESERPVIHPKGTKPLTILSKPRPIRTEKSIVNCIEGKVFLRATFYSNGKIGQFKVIKGLPFGLTYKAIEAAKKIKFEPEIKDFQKISVRKTIEYGFWLY